jgi:hypothetical protein
MGLRSTEYATVDAEEINGSVGKSTTLPSWNVRNPIEEMDKGRKE